MFANEQILFDRAMPQHDAIPVGFAFPNCYAVGITSLGYQMIWAMLARREDVAVARLFTDLQEDLLSDPELLGFSFSWELDYVNILSLLDRLGIPRHTHNRQEQDPIVFGGGAVLTANPEPLADFFDVILLGDGEGLIDALIDAYKEIRTAPRLTKLIHLAQIPGIYIPSLYQPIYHGSTDPIRAIVPIHPGIPVPVPKNLYRGKALSVSMVVTPQAAWENIYMVEVVRSCPEMCRFCLASYLTLPFRTALVEEHLIPAVERGIQVTSRIGLLGASVTQHPQFSELLEVMAQDQFKDVHLSVSSVRTNTVTPRLAEVLRQRGSRSITVAIESGSERLRQIINKKLSNEEILTAAAAATQGGLQGIKFYGMVGIPGEEISDLEETITLFKHLKKGSPKLRYTFGCSTFVPKAQTPFQWYGVSSTAEKRLKMYAKQFHALGVEFRPESYNWSVIQALISRGDRRITQVLELAATFGDSLGSYKRAFKELQNQLPPLDYYVHQDWPLDTTLPWSHLEGSLSGERLLQHRDLAVAAMTRPQE